jgi:hypothetical protein
LEALTQQLEETQRLNLPDLRNTYSDLISSAIQNTEALAQAERMSEVVLKGIEQAFFAPVRHRNKGSWTWEYVSSLIARIMVRSPLIEITT